MGNGGVNRGAVHLANLISVKIQVATYAAGEAVPGRSWAMTYSPSEAGPKVYPHAVQMSESWQRTRLRKIRKEYHCWLRKGSEVRTQKYLVLCEVMPRNSKIPS